jgi:hypothetical protein
MLMMKKNVLSRLPLMQGRKSKIVDSIKLKVTAKMEDVTVKLENDIREITALEVSFANFLIKNISLLPPNPNFINDVSFLFPLSSSRIIICI